MAKRPREVFEDTIATSTTPISTPKKLRFDETATPTKSQQTTPSKRGRKPKATTASNASTPQTTPKSARRGPKSTFVTPTKPRSTLNGDSAAAAPNTNADRSARRKANRHLIQQTIEGAGSDIEEEDALARQIWDEDDGGAADYGSDTDPEDLSTTTTPSKVGGGGGGGAQDTPSKRARGRPKGSKNRRTPTPPPGSIPAHERYFFHNRASAPKSSSRGLSQKTLLTHAAYRSLVSARKDPHAAHVAALHAFHATQFPLWAFELAQGYAVCLFGYGSKRRLLPDFAAYLHRSAGPPSAARAPVTVLVNGHHPSLSMRSVLQTALRALGAPASQSTTTQPATLLAALLAHQDRAAAPPLYLLVSTLHSRALAAAPAQAVLAALAAHPLVRLVLAASNPAFPLLWASPARDALNLLFHDATTFLPYDDDDDDGNADGNGGGGGGTKAMSSELGAAGVVDSVAELMGRKGSAAASRERVRWVLRSLPENARGLYRILVAEILAAEADGLEGGGGGGGVGPGFDDDGMHEEGGDGGKRGRVRPGGGGGAGEMPGIDSKVLYQKATEEFLCSSEMAFRGLLREFLDHAMVAVRKEGATIGGGEILGIDMPREELESVLEDLLE